MLFDRWFKKGYQYPDTRQFARLPTSWPIKCSPEAQEGGQQVTQTQDISASGMLIRVIQEPTLQLRLQQHVRLSVHLPPPVGVIDERVTIVRVAPGTNRTHNYIGIAFDGELAGLEDLVRELKDQQQPHRAAG